MQGVKFIAGIVTYNPDIKRLRENLNSITCQADKVVIIDNGSANFGEAEKLIHQEFTNVHLIPNLKNMGIAKALNQIMEYAEAQNYEWCLTLDQDSVCMDNLIERYTDAVKSIDSRCGMLTCSVRDRNFEFDKHASEDNEDMTKTDFCITSGSALRLEAWNDAGKFDESLFIDKVDTDMCWSLIEKGWDIYKLNFVGILHEIGCNTRRVKFLGKEIVVFNHNPMRIYYICRNGIICARKHPDNPKSKGMFKSSFHRILICICFEKKKLQKLIKGTQGIVDGYRISKNNKED